MTRILSIVLTITVFLLFTQSTFASDKITPYPPETKQTPAIEEKKEEKKGINWLWMLLGVAVVGGIAAAAGGGGGSSSSRNGDNTGGGGTVTVTY
jgi:hypothetical protein